MNNVRTQLEHLSDVVLEWDKNLKKFSTLQFKAQGDLITIRSKEALVKVVKLLKEKKYRILGLGANQLLDESYDGFYIKLNFAFDRDYLNKAHTQYILPASVSLAVLTSHAAKFGLKGWEVFTGIPATVGGALCMNAGTNLGDIGSLVKKVRLVSRVGELKQIEIDKDSFSYRKANFLNSGDIIYEVELTHFGIDENLSETIRDYLLKRNKSQPMNAKTCGCVFKNSNGPKLTCRAGEYIDIIGLKGLTYGGLSISELHANFMINDGDGSKVEMQKLIGIVSEELYLQYGIRFDTEVKF